MRGGRFGVQILAVEAAHRHKLNVRKAGLLPQKCRQTVYNLHVALLTPIDAVHLVYGDDELLNADRAKKKRVFARLAAQIKARLELAAII